MRSAEGEPLRGFSFHRLSDSWAASLLGWLGADVPTGLPVADAAADWAVSGAMAISGAPGQLPLLTPGRPASAAHGAIAALRPLAQVVFPHADRPLATLDGGALLGERAALSGWQRAAPWSLGRTARALRCADGWAVLNLARPDDVDAVAALFETSSSPRSPEDAWNIATECAGGWPSGDLLARAALLGLPLASIPTGPADHTSRGCRPWRISALGGSEVPRRDDRPLRVVDFSTLWAGPLAGSLLGLCGAEVIRVESARRPDGSRAGARGFDDLLHGGQASVSVDLTSVTERQRLQACVDSADVVITSARQRALIQFGLDPARTPTRPQVRVAITGYGLKSHRVGFGDDAAMAGGLFGFLESTPVPVGDALADPLAGLHAAVAAVACLASGGSWLVDVALARVSAAVAAPDALPAGRLEEAKRARGGRAAVHRHGDTWCVISPSGHTAVAQPRARAVTAAARPLGADTLMFPA